MLPKKKHSIDDDYETRNRTVRAPEMCVDYLSYRFDEMDLAASWRVMTKQKKDVVNGLRLENASWRTWAKHKYRLSTVSPETLNWLKDSDVTWLYGPLHTVMEDIGEKDRYAKPKIASTEDTLGLMTPHRRPSPESTTSTTSTVSTIPSNNTNNNNNNNDPPLKSVLKKVTASDLLRRSASELQANQITTDDDLQDDQKKKQSSKSALSLKEANKKSKAFSPAIVATHRQPKLRFNQYVEQCVALSTNEQDQKQQKPRTRFANISSDEEDNDQNDNNSNNNNDTHDDEDEDDEEEEEGYSDDENAIIINYDHSNRSLPRSIKKIEPARLKTSSQSEQETDEVSSLSSSASSNNAWMVGGQQDHYHHRFNHAGHIVSTSSSSDEEDPHDDEQQLEIRRRAHYIPSSSSSGASSPSDAIQWVGQSCVYNVHQPSDYDEDDYGFDDDDDDDDDDWIHDENEVPSPPLPPVASTPTSPPPSSSSTASPTSSTPSLPCHPRGQQFLGKAVAVNGPSPIDADEPSISRVSNYRKITTDNIHSHNNVGESSNNNSSTIVTNNNEDNPTIFGHIAQWASSYLWPKQPSSSPSSSHP
ncbi:hypothetical protein BDC45DRAFT_563759 [Circinella umbellata]|nr:hypothetical protein BDC45DRAFT_563759 [Circinella umbellata]